MTTTQTTLARELGICYAEAVRDNPAVKSVWVRPIRDYVQVWVETEPIPPDADRKLISAAQVLDERFPETYFELHIANPRYHVPGTQMVGQVIPRTAELVYQR